MLMPTMESEKLSSRRYKFVQYWMKSLLLVLVVDLHPHTLKL